MGELESLYIKPQKEKADISIRFLNPLLNW
jgi:hypothetical protein